MGEILYLFSIKKSIKKVIEINQIIYQIEVLSVVIRTTKKTLKHVLLSRKLGLNKDLDFHADPCITPRKKTTTDF